MDAPDAIESLAKGEATVADLEKGPRMSSDSVRNSLNTVTDAYQKLRSLRVTDVDLDGTNSRSLAKFHVDEDASQVPDPLPELAKRTVRIFDYSFTLETEDVRTGHPQAPKAWKALTRSLDLYVSTSDALVSEDPTQAGQAYDAEDICWQWSGSLEDHSSYPSISAQVHSWKQATSGVLKEGMTSAEVAKKRDRDPFMTRNSHLKCCAIDGDSLIVFHRFDALFSDAEASTSGFPPLTSVLALRRSLVSFSNGIRAHFIKLLLLDYIQNHIRLLIAAVRHHDPLWRTDEQDLLHGKVITEPFFHKIRYATTLRETANQLGSTIEHIERSLRLASRENEDSPLGNELEDHLLCLKHSSFRLNSLADEYLAHHQRNWDTQRDTLNASESESVKRLTILAVAFVPLSLSSSILAMQVRFVHLNLLLYDFVGVFVLLISIAILFYFVIAGVLRWMRWGRSQSMEFASGRMEALATEAERLVSPHKIMDRWATVVYYGNYICPWTITTVSFVVGMVQDVILGLKILAFGFVGYLGLVLISFGFVVGVSAI